MHNTNSSGSARSSPTDGTKNTPTHGDISRAHASPVVVDVVEVPMQVVLVPNRVLPESSLPHPAPLVRLARDRNVSLTSSRREPRLSERLLDQTPPRRKITVAHRQRPYRVQMIRQQYERLDLKWAQRLTQPKRRAQHRSRFRVA